MQKNQTALLLGLSGAGMLALIFIGLFVFNKGSSYTPEPLGQQQDESLASSDVQEAQKIIVRYTSSGYEHTLVSVKANTTVTFVNESSAPVWTATDPHPTHSLYPEDGGCIKSAFDQCMASNKGETWEFTFSKAGTWGYHNHLKPSHKGRIIVE